MGKNRMKSGEDVGYSGPQAEGAMHAGTLKEGGKRLRLHHGPCCGEFVPMRGMLRRCTDTSKGYGV